MKRRQYLLTLDNMPESEIKAMLFEVQQLGNTCIWFMLTLASFVVKISSAHTCEAFRNLSERLDIIDMISASG